MLLPMSAGLPSVEYDGYIMSFPLFIGDKQLYELFPFLAKVAVLYADKVVSVYDDLTDVYPPVKVWAIIASINSPPWLLCCIPINRSVDF